MQTEKNYGGIIGHEKEKEIGGFIRGKKIGGSGFRKISGLVKNEFGLVVSHTTISNYYKEILGGGELDRLVKDIKESEGEGGELSPIDIDPDRVLEVREGMNEKDYWDTGKNDPLKDLYAKVIVLCEHSVSSHIKGESRLKTEYIKYLYDLKKVMKE